MISFFKGNIWFLCVGKGKKKSILLGKKQEVEGVIQGFANISLDLEDTAGIDINCSYRNL